MAKETQALKAANGTLESALAQDQSRAPQQEMGLACGLVSVMALRALLFSSFHMGGATRREYCQFAIKPLFNPRIMWNSVHKNMAQGAVDRGAPP